MTNKEIKSLLRVSTVSKKNGVYTIRKGYFYRIGFSAELLVERVKENFPNAVIIDSGDHFTSFSGGASVANSSHWYVKFTI